MCAWPVTGAHQRRPLETSPATDVTAATLSTQHSPDPDTLQQILHNYRTGRAQEAITELASWPVDRLVAAAKASTPKPSSSDRMAAPSSKPKWQVHGSL